MTLRILLADDSDQFRAAVRNLLQQEPDLQMVGEASDGTAAIQQAQALLPDVVLMDMKMPNENGVEATRQIVSLVSSAKVLGLSLHTEVSDVHSMVDAGASGFVSKVDAFEDLVKAIRFVEAGEPYFSPALPPPFGIGEEDSDSISDDY